MKRAKIFFDKIFFVTFLILFPAVGTKAADLCDPLLTSGPGIQIDITDDERQRLSETARTALTMALGDISGAREAINHSLGLNDTLADISNRMRPTTDMTVRLRHLPGEDLESIFNQLAQAMQDSAPETRLEKIADGIPFFGDKALNALRQLRNHSVGKRTPLQIVTQLSSTLERRRRGLEQDMSELADLIRERLEEARDSERRLAELEVIYTTLVNEISVVADPTQRELLSNEILLPVADVIKRLSNQLTMVYSAYAQISTQERVNRETIAELQTTMRNVADYVPMMLKLTASDARTTRVQSDVRTINAGLAKLFEKSGQSHLKATTTATTLKADTSETISRAIRGYSAAVAEAAAKMREFKRRTAAMDQRAAQVTKGTLKEARALYVQQIQIRDQRDALPITAPAMRAIGQSE